MSAPPSEPLMGAHSASDAELGQALSGSPVCVFRQDAALRYRWFTPSRPPFLPEHALGHTDRDVMPPEVARDLEGFKQEVLRTGRGLTQHVEIPGPAGHQFFEVHLRRVDIPGQPPEVEGTAIHLARYEETEAALRSSRALFEGLSGAVPDHVWMTDASGVFLHSNPAYQRFTGMTVEEFRAADWRTFLHPEDRDRVVAVWEEALHRAGPFKVEYRMRSAEGTYRRLVTQGGPMRDERGRILRWIGINTDVTVQRTMEEALRDSEQRFRIMADESPFIIWVHSPDGRLQFINRAYTEFFGVTTQQVEGEGWQPLVHPEDRDRYSQAFYEAHTQRRPFRAVLRVRRRDGEWRYFESCGAPRFSPDGEYLGMVGSSPDITERYLLEQQLVAAREAAERANHTKTEFLGSISHEVRTPLSTVVAMTDLALEVKGLPASARELLTGARSAADSLVELLKDLLDFSRIEAGRIELESIPFEFEDVLAGVVATLGSRARDKGLQLACEVDDSVPARLIGDPLRLRQVLFNLVGNAVKYTAEGHVRIAATACPKVPAGVQLVCRVEDTGIGIAADMLERIFEPFTQGDRSTTRLYGGTGLGLAIVKRLVRKMGGEVRVESEPGRGSVFEVRMELGRDPTASAGPDDEAHRTVPLPRVALVARPGIHRLSVESLLQRLGLDHCCYDGLFEFLADGTRGECLLLAESGMLAESMVHHRRGRLVVREHPGPLVVLGVPGPKQLRGATWVETPVLRSRLRAALRAAASPLRRRPAARPVPSPEVEAVAPRRLRVLVADDLPANRRILEMLLGLRGHEVTAVADAASALEVLRGGPVDVVLMDLEMPHINGLEALRRIRELEQAQGRSRAVPVIALTAHALKGDRERCLAAGMNAYISKPFGKDDLLRTVEHWGLRD